MDPGGGDEPLQFLRTDFSTFTFLKCDELCNSSGHGNAATAEGVFVKVHSGLCVSALIPPNKCLGGGNSPCPRLLLKRSWTVEKLCSVPSCPAGGKKKKKKKKSI